MDSDSEVAKSKRPRNYASRNADDGYDAPYNDDRNRRPRGDPESRTQNPRSEVPFSDQGSKRPTEAQPPPPAERRNGPRKSRSNSRVRIKDLPPYDSDDSNDGFWVTHRDGRKEFIPDDHIRNRAERPDRERNGAPAGRQSRDKRDDYEPDGRESPRGARNNNYDYPSRDTRSRGDAQGGTSVKERLAAGAKVGLAAGATAGIAAAATKRSKENDPRDMRGYDSEGPRPRRRPTRQDYDDGDSAYDRRPNPRRPRDDMGDSNRRPPSTRAPPGSRYSDDYYDDRGNDRPAQGRRRRYDDYYNDRDDDRRGPPRRAKSLGRDRDYDRDRDRDRDRYDSDYRRSRDSDKGKSNSDWKKQAGALFMTSALPLIQKEGGKLLRKKLEEMSANRH